MTRNAIIHPFVQRYISRTDLYKVTEYGTRPCKILFPKLFEKNIHMMKMILNDSVIDYRIYFANKATKSNIFVKTAKKQNIWLDVSSLQELQDALAIWYNPEHIIGNGPKDLVFLRLCLENNILISVDSLWEIKKILDLHVISQSKIMLRICPPISLSPSRFGITQEDLLKHIDMFIEVHKKYHIHWLNFHIDSIASSDKQEMIRHIIQLRENLLHYNITIQQLWIWWWFGIQYVQDIWIKQISKEYPQWVREYWFDVLDELLHTPLADWLNFAQYLRETMTTLHIEPWKLLLDQCGICIHHILDKKENKLFIDGNMYSLGTIWQEMPHDPLVYTANKTFSEDKQAYMIFWNLCMEHDKIFSRTIELPENIDIWDILIFVNTAGYFSDFSNSQPIKHNERKTIIVS